MTRVTYKNPIDVISHGKANTIAKADEIMRCLHLFILMKKDLIKMKKILYLNEYLLFWVLR